MTFVTFVVSVSDRYCNHRGFYQIFNVFNDYTKVIEHISLNMNVCLIILYFICIFINDKNQHNVPNKKIYAGCKEPIAIVERTPNNNLSINLKP